MKFICSLKKYTTYIKLLTLLILDKWVWLLDKKKYNVTVVTIGNIVSGKTWK